MSGFELETEATVHLHVRGADGFGQRRGYCDVGSSPRAWSRRCRRPLIASVTRFISTCVEQTQELSSRSRATAVHLHVRGADSSPDFENSSPIGSSPRAWSRLEREYPAETKARFISTCVEQTNIRASSDSCSAVHLHVRGADIGAPSVCIGGCGSSPRAWSRQPRKLFAQPPNRFISTCVEQTGAAPKSEKEESVHLHVRGADVLVCDDRGRYGGSSPRAWSRHLERACDALHGRFISTCVEQTD